MFVSVQFHGPHRLMTNRDQVEVSISENDRVGDLFKHLQGRFPDLQMAAEDVTITVNDAISTVTQTLNPNDTVAFLPHIGGG